MSWEYNEDNLVEQATVDILQSIGWEIETAWNNETFGVDGLLGRNDKSEVVLQKYLLPKLKDFNPDLPEAVYNDAYQQLIQPEADKTLGRINKERYTMLKKGIPVSYTDSDGVHQKKKLKVFDFENPKDNHFLAVRQFEVDGNVYKNKRPDVIGFVNGIPLVFLELKAHYRDLRNAYEDNLKDYKDTIPHLFYTNALVILSNGLDTKDESGTLLGTITSPFQFYHEWKRISEDEEGAVSLETTLRGTCDKSNLLDIFENFILFDDAGGDVIKIVSKNHQFLGVNKALKNVEKLDEMKSKLGVFWHTQGSGKSFSMVFLAEKIHRTLRGSHTILIVVDRGELERQIYDTFTAVGAVTEKAVIAQSRDDLRKMLKENHRYIFTLIHKFSIDPQKETEYPLLSERNDIIVLSDEAHRTQGGVFARNMRYNALPNASFLGFTGTPLIKGEEDEPTRDIFGDYVSVYDFKAAIADGATLPLLYVNKGEKLQLKNPKLDEEMATIVEEENLDEDQEKRLQREFSRNYPILTAESRLRSIAKDLVWHFNDRGYQGKAMLVAIDKPTAVRMYDYIGEYWPIYLKELEDKIKAETDEQNLLDLKRRYEKAKDTEVCVVVSSEQNEVDKFRKYGLEIEPHRKRMVERNLEKEFKDPDNPFRLAIVCAMWITGFDAPSISTVYLDKPIKGHTLMQTIARANRVYDDEKENGLIVDYGNVYEQLKQAYGTYGEGGKGKSGKKDDPTGGEEDAIESLQEALETIQNYLKEELAFDVTEMLNAEPLKRLELIKDGINAVCYNEKTRAKFELLARDMFRKYKALSSREDMQKFTKNYNAVEAIYNGLNKKVRDADITSVIVKLQKVVNASIDVNTLREDEAVYIDLKNLDFEKLKQAYQKAERKNEVVFDLQQAIEKKLENMMKQNPVRMEFYEKYQEIIIAYNNGKDAEATKKAFEDLVDYLKNLNEEDSRAAQNGLDEESQAIVDLLLRDKKLKKAEEEKVKSVAKDILEKLKANQLQAERWRESTQLLAQVQTAILDNLYHLPQEAFPDDELEIKKEVIFQHIYSHYFGGGRSVYNTVEV